MPYRRNYPATVAEILDDHKKFKPEALRAMRAYRAAKPWRGTDAERLDKMRWLLTALAAVYHIPTPSLTHCPDAPGSSYYQAFSHRIVLHGKPSVLTLIHEFCHARGLDERDACSYSINLFRRIFPRSFAKLTPVGHTLVRQDSPSLITDQVADTLGRTLDADIIRVLEASTDVVNNYFAPPPDEDDRVLEEEGME